MERPTIITLPCKDGRIAVNVNKVLYVLQMARSSVLHFGSGETVAVNIDLDATVRLMRGIAGAEGCPSNGAGGIASRPVALVGGAAR